MAGVGEMITRRSLLKRFVAGAAVTAIPGVALSRMPEPAQIVPFLRNNHGKPGAIRISCA